jgi:hypothetical protein
MPPEKPKPYPTTETTCDGIACSKLTHCDISKDGTAIRFNLITQGGTPAFVDFLFDDAASIVMTVPRLLTAALQIRSGRSDLRYVFPVDKWALEMADGNNVLIFTLRTDDGFDASFGLSLKMCKDIGSVMNDSLTEAAQKVATSTKKH